MKLAVDESVELEFNEWNLEQAAKCIAEIKDKHRERSDDVLRAVFSILLFGQMEQQRPGVFDRLSSAVKKAAETLNGLKPESK